MAHLDAALIAVVGAVEGRLLHAFIEHYRTMGVSELLLALHIDDSRPGTGSRADEMHRVCAQAGVVPAHIELGPWTGPLNGQLRDHLRAQASSPWHLLADADEFQHYPGSLQAQLESATARDEPIIEGVLYDRLAADGRFPHLASRDTLSATFPLGGFLTHTLLDGDCRKVVACRPEVEVLDGNHRSPRGPSQDDSVLVPVHHYKWRAGVVEYLQRRLTAFGESDRRDEAAMAAEVTRFLDHIGNHGGAVNIDEPRLGIRRVDQRFSYPQWEVAARQVWQHWWYDRWASPD